MKKNERKRWNEKRTLASIVLAVFVCVTLIPKSNQQDLEKRTHINNCDIIIIIKNWKFIIYLL